MGKSRMVAMVNIFITFMKCDVSLHFRKSPSLLIKNSAALSSLFISVSLERSYLAKAVRKHSNEMRNVTNGHTKISSVSPY